MRSWDRERHDGGNGEGTSRVGEGTGELLRVVTWPEGAPPQSEVPHAGSKVVSDFDPGRVFTVQSGIPYQSQGGSWCLRVGYSDSRGGSHIRSMAVAVAKPYVEPTPERTYSEAEIRTAYAEHGAYSAEEFISDLRENK